jgi:hypothetical protein
MALHDLPHVHRPTMDGHFGELRLIRQPIGGLETACRSCARVTPRAGGGRWTSRASDAGPAPLACLLAADVPGPGAGGRAREQGTRPKARQEPDREEHEAGDAGDPPVPGEHEQRSLGATPASSRRSIAITSGGLPGRLAAWIARWLAGRRSTVCALALHVATTRSHDLRDQHRCGSAGRFLVGRTSCTIAGRARGGGRACRDRPPPVSPRAPRTRRGCPRSGRRCGRRSHRR